MENMDTLLEDVAKDVSRFERHFRSKIYELQDNADTLRAMQKELLETRHALYSTELLLEKERGVSHELRMQLRTATDTMKELRHQQMGDQIESVQTQIKYDEMSKQRDSLTSEIMSTKTREIEYRIKIQSLEETLQRENMTNAKLDQALKELERNSFHAIDTIDHNLTKLKQEHQCMTKSCERIISLNQRLQTVGLCAYAIHQKDKTRIKGLECTLASISIGNVEYTDDDVPPQMKKLKAT